MKHDKDMFVEYDDNNISHIENGPDYGESNGSLKWTEDSYSPYSFPFTSTFYKNYNILNILSNNNSN